MKEIIKRALKEIIRIGLSAVLAAIGIETSGCVAVGDGATASVAFPSSK